MSARDFSSTGYADELSEEERRAAELRRNALAGRLQMAAAPAWNADGTAGSGAALGVSVPRLNLSKVHKQEQELTPRRPLPFSMRSKKLQSPSLSYLGVSSRRPTAPAAGSASGRMTSTARMGRLRDADGSATVFGTTERKVATPPEAAQRGMPRENAQRQLPTSSKLTARQAAAGEMPSFMDVLQEDPNFHISHIDGSSFVYLVPRLGSMYDLAVADPLQVDPSACITLSKAGLTFSKADGEIEFLSIDEFEREYFLFHTILKVCTLPERFLCRSATKSSAPFPDLAFIFAVALLPQVQEMADFYCMGKAASAAKASSSTQQGEAAVVCAAASYIRMPQDAQEED